MLPTHNNHAAPQSEQSAASIKHYSIKSSDVIDQRSRVTVEDDQGMLWYKTRELTEHEIVDSLTDSKTNQTRWTVHQPSKRGWYLRLRSPLFPPGACIALTPPQAQAQASAGTPGDSRVATGAGGGGGAEPILVFGCQTLVPSEGLLAAGSGVMSNRSSVDHSYPPSRSSISSQTQVQTQVQIAATGTPNVESQDPTSDITEALPASSVQPSTSSASPTKPLPSSTKQPSPAQVPRWHVTHYTLKTGIPASGLLSGTHHHPHLVHPPTHGAHAQPSFLHRLTNLAGGGTGGSGVHHFTIQPASTGFSFAPSSSGASDTVATGSANSGSETRAAPFIAFTDSTPILRATPSATLSVDVECVRELGVEMAFWVAVSLAFWEFLREREGYLAASED